MHPCPTKAYTRTRNHAGYIGLLSHEALQRRGCAPHALSGDLTGQYSVRVSGNWRVIFEFENGDAYIVDYDDYH